LLFLASKQLWRPAKILATLQKENACCSVYKKNRPDSYMLSNEPWKPANDGEDCLPLSDGQRV
jgi:hypothetical protein